MARIDRTLGLVVATLSLLGFKALSIATVVGLWTIPPALAMDMCPIPEATVAKACSEANGKEPHKFGVLVFMAQKASKPLYSCGCPKEVAAPPAKYLNNGKKFKGVDSHIGIYTEGSHCLELCKSSTSGTGGTDPVCYYYCTTWH